MWPGDRNGNDLPLCRLESKPSRAHAKESRISGFLTREIVGFRRGQYPQSAEYVPARLSYISHRGQWNETSLVLYGDARWWLILDQWKAQFYHFDLSSVSWEGNPGNREIVFLSDEMTQADGTAFTRDLNCGDGRTPNQSHGCRRPTTCKNKEGTYGCSFGQFNFLWRRHE